ncbi:glycosyltransferase [Aeromonas caviae]|uniref:glycosyltransferase n=1 Tax=Aeromonas caviae TaxID=648 RepID=UPI0038CFF814
MVRKKKEPLLQNKLNKSYRYDMLDKNDIYLIDKSGLFDSEWYMNEYPDVVATGISSREHFIKYGIHIGRNPGPKFNGNFYLKQNPDVKKAGINPLIHYIKYGMNEGRAPSYTEIMGSDCAIRIDIVVPVFNALNDVKSCLYSLKDKQDGYAVKIIVVNDGSDEETTNWLRSYCHNDSIFELHEHPVNRGYTQAVNTGLRVSNAPYVITQNSDTIATNGWLRGLVRCINSSDKIGIAGPLSNAASWQNVPDLYDENRHFAVNDIPNSLKPDEMAAIVAKSSNRIYPKLPFVNGFCFMIKREVIDKIGIMDEENFPIGYGEENDFCIRAADAGYELAIADDTYVYHAKSKSFGHSRRAELSKQGSDNLKKKHGHEKYASLVEIVKNTELLDRVRSSIKSALKHSHTCSQTRQQNIMSMKILFLLPVKGGSGGAHSVVQEVTEMRRLGMDANIAVKKADLAHLRDLYQDIDDVNELFIGFENDNLIHISEKFDIVVATIFTSVSLLKKIIDVNPHILPAYYAQDYEPMFFPAESDNWHVARESYSLIPNAIIFAKTHWIADKIKQEHSVKVYKVSPSIDHSTYKPTPKVDDNLIHISAMIRPQTPRRGAERTMKLFSRLAKVHKDKIIFHLFGCESNDERFKSLPCDFEFENRGILKRPEVASLLSQSDIFVDLSDYQAFGRTSLEAMACGATAVVPIHGGGDEYAQDNINALVVDTFDEELCFNKLNELLQDGDKIKVMQAAGLLTAANYSVHQAAISEICLFQKALAKHRAIYPKKDKPVLMLMPERRGGGLPAGSGYVRVVLPYTHPSVQRHWHVIELKDHKLPEPGSAHSIVIQRQAGSLTVADLESWLVKWRAAGGRFIYEIDDDLLDADGLIQRGFKGDTELLVQKVRWLASNADIVMVSTSELMKVFSAYNSQVHLVPNFLDEELWRIGKPKLTGKGIYQRKEGDPIRIGYIGTPTHVADLEMIADAMKKIEKEFGDKIEIEVIGGFQNTKPLFGKRVGLPKNNDYPSFVNWLQKRVHWDIGIIPLVDDKFNKSKSHLKFLEYSALKLPVIVSNVETYSNICKQGENALVVNNDTNAWYVEIKRLIIDASLREKLSENSYSKLKESHVLHISPIIDIINS